MSTKNTDIQSLVQQFNEQGYLVVRNVLSEEKVDRLNKAIDEITGKEPESLSYSLYNCVERHPEVFSMIDEPTILPIIVNALGFNIQMQISHLSVRHHNPHAKESEKSKSFIQWHQDGPHPQFPALNGITPIYYIKACYLLSDLSEPNRGNTKVIPGSHKKAHYKPEQNDPKAKVEGEIQITGKPGDVFLFPNNMWHSAAPNESQITRKQLFIGYSYLWMKPIDYRIASEELLAQANSKQRQLLGYVDENPFRNYVPVQDELPLKKLYLGDTGQSVYN